MKYLSFAIIAALITACGTQTQTSSDKQHDHSDSTSAAEPPVITQLAVKPLEGYFIKNAVKVTDSLSFWIIDNPKSFDSLFAPAKTMNNQIINPDFGTELVIAVSMPTTSYGTTIQLQKAEINDKDNAADLHFIATAGEKKSFTTNPVWIGSIAKSGLKTLHFFTGDQLSKTSNITQ